MKRIDYLIEKYFSGANLRPWGTRDVGYIEVFENPSRKEFLEIAGKGMAHDMHGKNVRFWADLKKKKVYIQPAHITHLDVYQGIKGLPSLQKGYDEGWLLTGVATQKGSDWVMTSCDAGCMIQLRSHPPNEWEWADKYIKVTPFLKKQYAFDVGYRMAA